MQVKSVLNTDAQEISQLLFIVPHLFYFFSCKNFSVKYLNCIQVWAPLYSIACTIWFEIFNQNVSTSIGHYFISDEMVKFFNVLFFYFSWNLLTYFKIQLQNCTISILIRHKLVWNFESTAFEMWNSSKLSDIFNLYALFDVGKYYGITQFHEKKKNMCEFKLPKNVWI